MIKVDYMMDTSLKKWYWEHISNKIYRTLDKIEITNSLMKEWVSRIKDEVILYDIIFCGIDLLKQRYEWIQEYVCCNPRELMEQNEVIKQIIRYSFLSTTIKQGLVERMGVRVCPYCNQQYIYSVIGKRGKKHYLGDIDHVHPKGKYPLFSLSLWNLVPACKSCNQTLKGTLDVEILSPVEDGFGDDCIFDIDYHSASAMIGASDDFDVRWKPRRNKDNKQKIAKIQGNIFLFELDELYKVHKAEIRSILRKKALFYSNDVYLGSVNKTVGDEDTVDYVMFAEYLDETNYTLLPHAKMIHDILKWN